MKYPEITAYSNGILEWATADGAGYALRIGGIVVSNGADGLYYGGSVDTRKYKGAVTIELGYAGSADVLRLETDAKKTQLRLAPVTEYAFDAQAGILSWRAVCGAHGYKVVDIESNASYVTRTAIDITQSKLIVGVYPISYSDVIGAASERPVHINYLDGSGTENDPYRIRTAHDLRAIDYYESMYAESAKLDPMPPRNRYRIEQDIDYATVAVGDEESNVISLAKPFFGTLDGNGKKLIGMRVRYDLGYWALFDFIACGATVENITFERPEITNTQQSAYSPSGAMTATVAHVNHGTIANIIVSSALYTASGGEVCGICSHNHGTVKDCTVGGTFVQDRTGATSQACYEMSGVVLENVRGGLVAGNKIKSLTIRGTGCTGASGSMYFNVRTAAGIVAVNRAGGTVKDNSFGEINMTHVNTDTSAFEFGGLVAYNAGRVEVGAGRIGKFKHNGVTVTAELGTADIRLGTVVGKCDGETLTEKGVNGND